MASEASASPQKSTSSELTSKSSGTTSVPDISSLSSLSSRSKNEIAGLRQRVELLNAQLRQKDIELDENALKQSAERDSRAEVGFLKLKCSALSSVCDELRGWIATCEREAEARCAQLEALFRQHATDAASSSAGQKEEAGRLRAELRACEGKIGAIVHENSFLRWENGQLKTEVSTSRSRLDEELAVGRVLRAQLASAKKAAAEGREKEKRELELHATVCKSGTTIEKLKRIQDDREKEYGITLTRLKNELDFVTSEMERKEEVTESLVQMIDRLSMDNRALQDRIETAERVQTQRLSTVAAALASPCREAPGQPPPPPPQTGFTEIEIDTDDVVELKRRVREARAEAADERAWRADLLRIQLEMARDMRTLILDSQQK